MYGVKAASSKGSTSIKKMLNFFFGKYLFPQWVAEVVGGGRCVTLLFAATSLLDSSLE
jgi:hypothetical protein